MTIFALLSAAHPGHGLTEPSSWQHYIVEPVHAVPVLLVIAAAIALVVAVARGTREFYR
jgi:hypothetical protein